MSGIAHPVLDPVVVNDDRYADMPPCLTVACLRDEAIRRALAVVVPEVPRSAQRPVRPFGARQRRQDGTQRRRPGPCHRRRDSNRDHPLRGSAVAGTRNDPHRAHPQEELMALNKAITDAANVLRDGIDSGSGAARTNLGGGGTAFGWAGGIRHDRRRLRQHRHRRPAWTSRTPSSPSPAPPRPSSPRVARSRPPRPSPRAPTSLPKHAGLGDHDPGTGAERAYGLAGAIKSRPGRVRAEVVRSGRGRDADAGAGRHRDRRGLGAGDRQRAGVGDLRPAGSRRPRPVAPATTRRS